LSAEVAKKAEAAGELSLVGPLAFWIGFLIIAMILDIAAAYAAQYDFGLVSYLAKTANSIIYMPGAIVLPLVASLWMGVRVGRVSNKPRTVLYAGLVNALYALIVYIISISVVYLILMYANPSAISGLKITLGIFLEYLIAAPAAITIILVPLFSTLSAVRRS
jgi:hypothetical protein